MTMNDSLWSGQKIGGYLLAIAFFSLSVFIFYDVFLARASKSWPFMTGTVTRSSGNCVPGKSYNCTADVSYAYGVYRGRAQVHSDSLWYTGKSETTEMLKNFGEGAPVRVRYDPDAPGRSRLEGAGAMDWRVGAFFLALAWFVYFLAAGGTASPAAVQAYARPAPAPEAWPDAAQLAAARRGRRNTKVYGLLFSVLGIVIVFLVNFFLALRRPAPAPAPVPAVGDRGR